MKPFRYIIAYVAAVAALLAVACVARAADKSKFGVNLPPVNYYQPGSGYLVDAAKSAERIPGMVWGELPFRHTLSITFDGTGTVNGLRSGSVTTTGGGVFKATTAGDFRNLRLLRTGNPPGALFTADGDKSLAPAGVLRSMDWLCTNGRDGVPNPVVRWSDRCKPEDQTWSGPNGGPIEPLLDYAVATGKDLWLNVPHQADDDYVRQLALLCKAKLGDAPVNLYLEDSNEVWNFQFPQTKWQSTRGGQKWHADRTIFIAREFRKVFGDADKRIRPVLGCGVGKPWERDQAIAHLGARTSEIYGGAIAPYFGDYGQDPAWSAQQFADHLLRAAKAYGTDASATTKGVRQFKAVCDRLGWKMLAYEGGADLGQAPPALKAKGKEAALADWERRVAASQLLPQTAEAVRIYLEWWHAEGGDVFCYFNQISLWNQSGVWGLESLPGQRGPKWQAWATVAGRFGTPPPIVTTQPTAPAWVKVVESAAGLDVTWAEVPGATYKVFRDGVQFDTSGNAHATAPKLPGIYTVKAIVGGRESAASPGFRYGPAADPFAAERARLLEIASRLTALVAERDALEAERAKLVEKIGSN